MSGKLGARCFSLKEHDKEVVPLAYTMIICFEWCTMLTSMLQHRYRGGYLASLDDTLCGLEECQALRNK